MTLRSAILAAVTGETAQETDPYYNLVSLHLKGDVNTGRSYNAFSDASSNNFRLTNSGDVRGSSFSPYGTSWSAFFDGTNDYVATPVTTNVDLGTSNFTIEGWVYVSATANKSVLVISNATAYPALMIQIGPTSAIFGSSTASSSWDVFYQNLTGLTNISNTWAHFAVSRSGNNFGFFINGLRVATATSAASIESGSNAAYIGVARDNNGFGDYFSGYISNVRLVKGSVVYDPTLTTLTVPTSPLTAIANTQLLLCQSGRFIDSDSPNTPRTGALALTLGDAPRISSFSPFLETDTTSGSGYFDGSGDYLLTPNNAAFQLGTGEFTIETWFYKTVATGGDVFSSKAAAGNDSTSIGVYVDSTSIYVWNNGAQITASSPPLNTWNHIAITRNSSNVLTLWLNGASVGTLASFTANLSKDIFGIGALTGGGETFFGYISNLRILKGVAVYTGNFTPPTAALAVTQSAGTNIQAITGTQTALLTLQERGAYNTIGFQDESEYQHIITRPSGANVAQGTFSPFSNAGWSNYFNGSCLTVPSGADFNLGTNDFCIEFWLNPISASTYGSILTFDDGDFPINFEYATAGGSNLRANFGSTSAFYFGIYFDTATATNAWSHYAVTRSGSTFRLFKDGVLKATATNSGAIGNSSSNLRINANNTASGQTYISNLRIINGSIPTTYQTSSTTVGTTIFAVPTSPLTTTSQGATAADVKLLTCQSNRFVDNSTANPKTISVVTANSTPTVVAFSPFAPVAYDPQVHGGSGYFDGSGDYLNYTQPGGVGNGDFTLELWLYPIQIGDTVRTVWECRSVEGGTDGFWLGSNTTNFYMYYASSIVISTSYPTVNAWTHVALVRSGNDHKLYFNGTQVGSTYTAANNYSNTSIFISRYFGSEAHYTNGYFSSLRLVKGTAVYTSNFTPPSGPLPLISNTSLLLNFTNGGVIDSTGKNVIETVGNSGVVTTAIKKYGSGSMYFDGTGDWLQAPTSPSLSFGSAPYTIEFWYRPNEVSNDVSLIAKYSTSFEWVVQYLPSASNSFRVAVNNNQVSDFASALSINTWYHIALCRDSSGNLRFFRDGVQVGSTVTSGTGAARDITATNDYLTIGVRGAGTQPTNGYIDDLRITKGYARYTTGTGANANQMVFTGTNTLALPTKAHPDRGTASTLTTDMAAPSSVDYLVVAGGGGGGGAGAGGGGRGGGGAGGFRTGTDTAITTGVPYTVTIGAGGSGGIGTTGLNGSNSVFNLITSAGGGAGDGNVSPYTGSAGGSGGGSSQGNTSSGGPGNTPSVTPSQGNNGGAGYVAPGTGSGGGGGGAGAAGSSGSANPAGSPSANGGNGGIGANSAITGSTITYAGGGGGAGYVGSSVPGSGGLGGGGAGKSMTGSATAGTANLGGGGGGGGDSVPGAAGGSGIVILAYPTSFRPLKASLGLVYTIDTVTRPGYRVYKFTAGTGSISW